MRASISVHLSGHLLRPVLAAGLLASCAVQDPAPVPQQTGGDVPDAFGARPVDPARTAELLKRAKDLVRPGSVMQTESRLGVPTFLGAPPPRASKSAVLTGVAHPEIAASRAALADYAPLYGLSATDVASAVVAHVHDLG